MPGRNGTGPSGEGPRTGRGLGMCQDYAEPGFFGNCGRRRGCFSGSGIGRGFGFGRGMGYGARQGFYPNAYSTQTNNKQSLKEYQDYLEKELQTVKHELEDDK